jgi:hypothetical protein
VLKQAGPKLCAVASCHVSLPLFRRLMA